MPIAAGTYCVTMVVNSVGNGNLYVTIGTATYSIGLNGSGNWATVNFPPRSMNNKVILNVSVHIYYSISLESVLSKILNPCSRNLCKNVDIGKRFVKFPR